MRIRIAIILLLAAITRLQAQQKEKGLQDFLHDAKIKPSKVMLVGTFHFAYQNLDQHKTDKKNMRNILSEKSQSELQEVLEVLRTYKPTRIYLESKD